MFFKSNVRGFLSSNTLIQVPLNVIIWIYDAFDNNFRIKNNFTKIMPPSTQAGNLVTVPLSLVVPEHFSHYEDATKFVSTLSTAPGMGGLRANALDENWLP